MDANMQGDWDPGQLIAASVGIDPRSTMIKLLFIVYGILALQWTFAFF